MLGVPAARIGRHDHFFDLGGTSLSAVKLVVALDRAITLKDVTRRPVLADLARLLEPHGLKEPPGCRSPTRSARSNRPPAVPRCCAPTPGAIPTAWAARQRAALRAAVAEHGCPLVRGLGLDGPGAAGAVFRRLSDALMPEREPFAPSAQLRGRRVLLHQVAAEPADAACTTR